MCVVFVGMCQVCVCVCEVCRVCDCIQQAEPFAWAGNLEASTRLPNFPSLFRVTSNRPLVTAGYPEKKGAVGL